MRAIPQMYDGTRYRSRTEARWAHFFDLAGVKYVYEPEGFEFRNECYVPDFYLPEADIFFEVKPTMPDIRERYVAQQLADESGKIVAIATGPVSAAVRVAIFATGHQIRMGYVVASYDDDTAWIVQRLDNDHGYNIRLNTKSANRSADGTTHRLLNFASRLQFPDPVKPDPSGPRHVGEIVSEIAKKLKPKQ